MKYVDIAQKISEALGGLTSEELVNAYVFTKVNSDSTIEVHAVSFTEKGEIVDEEVSV